MSIKLDLSKFKHHSSDKDSTTLIHEKDQHKITLAHKALSPQNREQLAALAKMDDSAHKPTDRAEEKQDSTRYANGGKVADKKKPSETIVASKASHGIQAANDVRKERSTPNGSTIVIPDEDKGNGKVIQKYAHGTPVGVMANEIPKDDAVDPLTLATATPTNVEYQAPTDTINPTGKTPFQRMVDKVGPEITDNLNASVGLPEAKPSPMQAPVDPQSQVLRPDQTAISNAAAENDSSKSPDKTTAQTIPGHPSYIQQAAAGDTMGTMDAGYNNKMAGIEAEAAAQGQLGATQAGILNRQVDAQNTAKMAYQKQYDALEAERQNHMQDIKDAHIDPNKYWTGDKDGNGSHSKIAAGIGMILAGFNPTSNPNAAVKFLEHQMDMNIQAQKENLNSEQNLLSANLKQFGNLKDATDMTRLMQADIVHNQLLAAADSAQTALAKAAALKAAGDVQITYAPLHRQMAFRTALASGALVNDKNPSDTSAAEAMASQADMFEPEVGKMLHAKIVPGIGVSTNGAVSDSVRSQLLGMHKLDAAGQDLLNYSKQHSNLIPGSPEYNYGVTKSMAFQQAVREGLLGTVFRESEKPLLEKFVNENPAGAFSAFTTQPKLRAILDSNKIAYETTKHDNGLPTSAPAEQIKIVNGVKYKRGPNGQAIPVK